MIWIFFVLLSGKNPCGMPVHVAYICLLKVPVCDSYNVYANTSYHYSTVTTNTHNYGNAECVLQF